MLTGMAAAAVMGLFSLAQAETGATEVVRPADTGQALVNPGMGWTLHFYSNMIGNYGSKLAPSDTVDDWPGLSTIYLRVPWAFLEPEEGRFNWSLLDTPAQRFIARGKRVALRLTCTESWLRYATPKWVQDAGAKGLDFEFGKGPRPGGPLWEPDYLDPVFLAKLENFLSAAAKRYDGNPSIDFIDVGSFGMWGEGHTGFGAQLDADRTLEVVKRHIDLHRRIFPRTLLAISDDVAGASNPGPEFPAIDYARERGITLRDDSILVQPPPKSWYHAEMAQAFWPTLPVVLEHEHYGPSKERQAWSNALLEKAVEDYHASYLSIHWWPREMLAETGDTVDRINRRLGYRLQLRELSWPSTVKLGAPFEVKAAWANAGVAPCLPGGAWAWTLKDDQGGIVSVQVADGFNMRDLKVAPPGEAPVTPTSGTFVVSRRLLDPAGQFVPAVSAGSYDVFVSVGRLDGTPTIALPLDGDDGQHRYRMGRIVVAGD
jgi:hypothetical protein